MKINYGWAGIGIGAVLIAILGLASGPPSQPVSQSAVNHEPTAAPAKSEPSTKPVVGFAENDACFGDSSRIDVSCTRLTEKFLLGLRGQTKEVVQKMMKAPGRFGHGDHFVSNYSRGEKTGSGILNVTYDDGGKAIIVSASVDRANSAGPSIEFIWNAHAQPAIGNEFDPSTKNFGRNAFCSDFSGRPEKCSTVEHHRLDYQITSLQMQSGATKAQLRDALDVACDNATSDPHGDCDRLRDRFR